MSPVKEHENLFVIIDAAVVVPERPAVKAQASRDAVGQAFTAGCGGTILAVSMRYAVRSFFFIGTFLGCRRAAHGCKS